MTNRLNTSEIDAIDDALSRLADSEGGAYESARAKIRRRRYQRRPRIARPSKAPTITDHQRRLLRLLRLGDFTFDAARGIWRFGTKRVADPAVADLIDRGLAIRFGDRVTLASPPISTELPAQADEPAAVATPAPKPLAAAAGALSRPEAAEPAQ